ncbi:MAG: hypothetical protein IKH53_07515 [Muribaculaceae bacterium]|nr:hypothetical protein [Muribaculaceae bacterium]
MKKKLFLTLLCSLAIPVVAIAATDDDEVTRANHEIYVEEATVAPGATATIAVRLKTASNMVSAFQFDLTLPEGITLNGDETSAIRKGGLETASHLINAAWMKSGACRVICYSTNNTKIKSLEGDAALIDIKVAPGMQPGTYPVKLTNLEMGRINGYSSVKPKNAVTYITVQPSSTPTDVQIVEDKPSDGDDATYNVLGQKVKKLRRGQIGVKRGKKVIKNEEGRK